MHTNASIHIRHANSNDTAFILSLVPRLTEFGPPSWRNEQGMTETDSGILADRLLNEYADTVIFIAADENNTALGFIHIQPGNDIYNKEKHGHISDLIVAPGAGGRGIGRLLMNKAEEWARSRQFRWLTLTVFAQNTRARKLYKEIGYGEDMIKCVKELK